MRYWLHRISHHYEVSYLLLERGILSIGWSDFSSEEFINKCFKKWDNFEKAFKEKGWLQKSIYSLWRFLSEMGKGDIVLVPGYKTFSLFEIIEDRPFSVEKLEINNLTDLDGKKIIKENNLLYREDNNRTIIDLGFFRKVNPLFTDISRNEYADRVLTSRMKIRLTNADITDLAKSIENAIEAFKSKKPINLHSLIVEETKKNVLKLINEKLNSDKFEKLIKWYFEKLGAQVEIPPKNKRDKEGDADIIATFEAIRTIIYVQAKYHVGETSEWAIEQINSYKTSKEAMDEGYAKIAWVISSGDFAEECRNKAKSANVILINGDEFANMLIDVGFSKLDDAF